ncbi:MAG: AAA family ATPase [Candidatus Promineifilaceae bacterium]|nr:AAA family ATPase [Candidatus Promineifilaceae bacterium]
MLCFVGVTGLPGAGKGEFVNILRRMLTRRGIETRYYSLSDELRTEARRRGLTVARPVLRTIANQLRLEEGSGVLSLMVVRHLRQDLNEIAIEKRLVVIIDAIRNPEEVLALRRQLRKELVLVAVEAPLEVLVQRIAARARFDEPEEFVSQKAAARKMILGESGKGEPTHGHNIAECMAMADWRIDNSRSLADLQQQTAHFVREMILLPGGNDDNQQDRH